MFPSSVSTPFLHLLPLRSQAHQNPSSPLKTDREIPIDCFEEPWVLFRGKDGKPGCVKSTFAAYSCDQPSLVHSSCKYFSILYLESCTGLSSLPWAQLVYYVILFIVLKYLRLDLILMLLAKELYYSRNWQQEALFLRAMALALFEEMKSGNAIPNYVSFVSISAAFSRARAMDVGLTVYESMKSRYGIEAGVEHYACVLDMLERAGMVECDYDFINPLKRKLPGSKSAKHVTALLCFLMSAIRVIIKLTCKDVTLLFCLKCGSDSAKEHVPDGPQEGNNMTFSVTDIDF
ncbi:hypothetical protein L1987_24911 [Smallanthus sonchifolius]|uniref:Uncharacterized protein n=1 Tax=Smallanthus sonchifolius TaxID=185202 RepID=A0ACB9IMN8_9ASTR|nr:hypothetical protein L1987_24911 [Smallanthus sonchifolius]